MKSIDISKNQSPLEAEALRFGSIMEYVVLVYFYRRYSNKEIAKNVRLVTLPFIEPKGPSTFILSILSSYLISVPVLAWIIMYYKVNILRADDILTSGFPSSLLSHLFRTPLVMDIMGNTEEVVRQKIGSKGLRSKLVLWFSRKIQSFVIKSSSFCIVVNSELEELARRNKAKNTIICYPPTYLNLSIFCSSDRRPNIVERYPNFTALFVGRLEPEKGPLNILLMAKKLKDVDFLIAGYGSLERRIKKEIKEKQLNNVKLVGLVDHKDLPSLYSRVHVLILPSYTEGLPRVMIEAMASAVPVIASSVGAVPQILNTSDNANNGGFAVPVGNIDEMISKVRLLKEDAGLLRRLGQEARKNIIENFSDSSYIDKHLGIYKEILLR